MSICRRLTILVATVFVLAASRAAAYECSQPKARGEIGPVNASGEFVLRAIPAEGWFEQWMYYYRGGWHFVPAGSSGQLLSVMCMYEPSELRVVPLDCYNNPYWPGEWTTMIGAPSTKPTIAVTVEKVVGGQASERRATLTWDLGEFTTPSDVRAWLLPWRSANGNEYSTGSTWGPSVAGRTGSYTFTFFVPDDGQQYIMHAAVRVCSATIKATADVSVDCDGCITASKNPVHFNDGNMRFYDSDPLPPLAGLSLQRTYNSDEQVKAFFGRGWTTILDRRLMSTTVDGERVVSVTTLMNELVTFRGSGDAYVQVWPLARRANAILTYDAATGTFTCRQAGESRVEVFREADGRLIEVRDLASGQSVSLTYNAAGHPLAITDAWTGTSWNVTVDAANRRVTALSVSTRPDLVWTYSYDGAGNLTGVTAPGNAVWRTYEYGSSNRLVASHDGAGNLIESHTYDANGSAISSTGDVDEIASIQYNIATSDPAQHITRVTYRTGATSDYVLRASGGAYRAAQIIGGCASCGTGEVTYVRDERGRVIRTQHGDGYVTTTTYTGDRIGSEEHYLRPSNCDPAMAGDHCRLSSVGLSSTALIATSATVRTTYTYGSPAWPDRATVIETDSVLVAGAKRTETFTLDPATGQVLQYTATGQTGVPPQPESHASTTALYDGIEGAVFAPGGAFAASWLGLPQPKGLKKWADGPRTDVNDRTELVYYPINPAVPALWRGRVAAVRNAAGHVTRYENYDVFATATRVVDANGVVRDTTHDILGRLLTSTIRAVPGCDIAADALCGTDLTTSRSYSPAAGPLTLERTPGGHVTTYEYDTRGRLGALSRGPSATDLRERIEYAYDASTGKKSSERYLAMEAAGWVEKRIESFAYDTLGRLATQTHADGTSIGYTYDSANAVATVRDENHTAANTRYLYDPAHRISAVKQSLGSASSGEIVTPYAYDLAGNLTRVTDPNGNVTTYVYDDFGRMLSQTSPVTGTTTYTYDPAGNLVATTDANGATTTRTFDALNRVTQSFAVRPPRDPETVTWSHDAASRFGLGRLASITDASGTATYSYERRGLVASEVKNIGQQSFTSAFRYDADAHRSSIRYPSGRVATFTFDYAGRPYSASSGATTLVSSAQYLPFGPAREIVYGNGTSKQVTYDSRYRLVTNTLAGSGERDALASYRYAYDNAGNITAIDDQIDPSYNRSFSYDDLNRLVAANSGSGLWGPGSYSYDSMGNLRALALGESRRASFTYAGTTPLLVSATENGVTRSMTYDAAGNERGYGNDAMTYTPSNHMEKWNATTYTYDGRGLRIITNRAVRIVGFSVTPSTVTGGNNVVGTVTISSPAPAGGATVALTANQAFAAVPASVTIAAGQTAVTFTINTTAVSGEQHALLTAAFNGSSTTASLTITGSRIDEVHVSPQSVVGGEESSGSITFAAPAPEEGLSLRLRSSDPAVTVPTELAVRGGARAVEFRIATVPVMRQTAATITVVLDAEQRQASLTVQPPSIASFSFAPSAIRGGSSAQGSIALTGRAPDRGLTITLASDSRLLDVPPSVVIEADQRSATFTAPATPVESAATVRVSAMLGEVRAEAAVRIVPPMLTGITVTPATATGGEAVIARTEIDGPAAEGGAAVFVSASDPSLIHTPQATTIAPGATNTTIPLATEPVGTTTPVVVSASRQGVNLSTTITLQPPPVTLQSLTVTPASVIGTNETVATVTLTGPAPAGGVEVELTSSASVAAVSPVVVVASGLTSATVRITTSLVAADAVVTITASHATTQKTASLAILTPSGNYAAGVTIAPAFVVGGSSAAGMVTLARPATEHGGADVLLSSSNPALSVPASMRINPNASTGSFTVASTAVTAPVPVVITATYGGVVQRFTVVVAPENVVTLAAFSVAPSRVVGGDAATVTVTLTGPAPHGGALVTVEARRRNIVSMPAVALVPEGASSTSFVVTTEIVHGLREKTVEIVASYNNLSASALLSVAPSPRAGRSETRTPVALCASLAPCMTGVTVPAIRSLGEQDGGPPPLPPPSLFETQYTLYSPELMLMTETTASSSATPALAYDYVWFAGQPLAQIETATGNIAWYFTDHLGTPLRQTDSSGRMIWHAEYEPYGSIYGIRRGESRHQPLRLPGQTAEDGADLYQNVFRFYRASLGRYTQGDPFGVHLYFYTGGDPVNWTDPLGLVKIRYSYSEDKAPMAFKNGCTKFKADLSYACKLIGCQYPSKKDAWKLEFTLIASFTIYISGSLTPTDAQDTLEHEYEHVAEVQSALNGALSHVIPFEKKYYDSKSQCEFAAMQALKKMKLSMPSGAGVDDPLAFIAGQFLPNSCP